MTPTGIVLAAGSGRRYGRPKALVEGDDGPWVVQAVRLLQAAGCSPVLVTVGAQSDDVRAVLPDGVTAVDVPDHVTGMGASLRAALAAVPPDAEQVVVTLVDLPDLTPAVVRRLLAAAGRGPQALARAAYDGTPGHPVLLGRDHFAGVRETAIGDRGAREYLAAHAVALVECGDLAHGHDVDF